MNITKTFLKVIIISLMIFSTLTFVAPTMVSAANCGDVPTALIDCGAGKENPIIHMLKLIVNFLSVGVGVVAVGGIVWGAVLYTTSNGDASKSKQGVTVIVNTVIGLLLFVFAYALMNFLIPGGLL
jgi:hypothetical protein